MFLGSNIHVGTMALRTAHGGGGGGGNLPEWWGDAAIYLPMDGENDGTSFPDESGNSNIVTASGNATTQDAVKKFGASALNLPGGASDFLTAPHSSKFNIGSNDFTLALWATQRTVDAVNSCGIVSRF